MNRLILSSDLPQLADEPLLLLHRALGLEDHAGGDRHHPQAVAEVPVHQPRLGIMHAVVPFREVPHGQGEDDVDDQGGQAQVPARHRNQQQIQAAEMHVAAGGAIQPAHEEE